MILFRSLLLYIYIPITYDPEKRGEEEKKFSKAKRKIRQLVRMREREHSFSLLLCNIERVYVCMYV